MLPAIVVLFVVQKSGLPASGGGMSGVVFHNIAEGIMAQSLKLDVKDARDSSSVLIPDVKAGNILAADYVLTHLGINTNKKLERQLCRWQSYLGKSREK